MKCLYIIADRPEQAGPDDRVFNASRPIMGDITWEGVFLHGIFYAAVKEPTEHLKKMDAWEIFYLTEPMAKEFIKRYFNEKHHNRIDGLSGGELNDMLRAAVNRKERRVKNENNSDK